ncbi:YicC/YloC family endoribonuclease [Yoonia sp. I 8.24]|uniref:YicC/YloC family endoribonuclease n=1 Tax=Yoonia sp. I 8.24 TaxID=1537229 RepID=UPI001EDD64B2|nr:YicC/YloC family endoribonuclease [Yoonia sp. I 8.24]MCG3266194.1 YicC family protein [Yoonia sp. I 8.24]
MTLSMTAFAARVGAHGAVSWQWEMRGVNARGYDLRLRLPEAIDGLEPALRKAVGEVATRGNITVNLRITREETAGELVIDEPRLDMVLSALDAIQERAFAKGVTLGQPTAADVLTQRGVLVAAQVQDDDAALAAAIQADIAPLVADFSAMRRDEGAFLHDVIAEQVTQIATLVAAAEQAATARLPQMRANLTAALQRIAEDVSTIEEGRIAQELAVVAMKADITEEIDRLKAHVQAARELLAQDAPSGRKFDFLAQEFNREANTLCAKAQSTALTAIGLDLKAVIDQMREQIQNVE